MFYSGSHEALLLEAVLWVSCHDEDQPVRRLALEVWPLLKGGADRCLSSSCLPALYPLLSHQSPRSSSQSHLSANDGGKVAAVANNAVICPGSHVRLAAGRAVAAAVRVLLQDG